MSTIGELEVATELRHADVAKEAAEPERPAVEDELAARRRAVAGRWAVELVEVTDATLAIG